MTELLKPPFSKTVLYDRFGRSLDAGDVVYLIGKIDVMWRVKEVAMVLDPSVPPEMLMISLTATLTMPAAGGMPLGDVLKVLDAKARPQTAGSGSES